MYSHETRVRLVKERVREIERQRKHRTRTLILTVLAVVAALGVTAFRLRCGRDQGG